MALVRSAARLNAEENRRQPTVSRTSRHADGREGSLACCASQIAAWSRSMRRRLGAKLERTDDANLFELRLPLRASGSGRPMSRTGSGIPGLQA